MFDRTDLSDFIPESEAREIRALSRRLAKRNPIRQLAETVLDRATPGPEAVSAALAALMAPAPGRWRHRAIAAWAFGRIGHTPRRNEIACESLRMVLSDRIQGSGLVRFGRAFLMSIGFVLLVGCLVLIRSGGDRYGAVSDLFGPVLFLALLLSPLSLAICNAVDKYRAAHGRAWAARSLARLPQIESIGPLARSMTQPNPVRAQRASMEALPSVLAILTPADYGKIDSRDLSALCHVLSCAHESLAIPILGALEKIGTGSCVYVVENLSRSGNLRIREAANRILPVMRERNRNELAALTLLRPTVAPVPDELLLRPASNTESDSEILLRPSA